MPHPSFPVRAALCLAGAAAVPSAPALAQAVTLYGLLDASVEHLTDVGQGGASLNRMPGLTGSVPSRIGLRGSEARELADWLPAVPGQPVTAA